MSSRIEGRDRSRTKGKGFFLGERERVCLMEIVVVVVKVGLVGLALPPLRSGVVGRPARRRTVGRHAHWCM